jgi:hypothetical protein
MPSEVGNIALNNDQCTWTLLHWAIVIVAKKKNPGNITVDMKKYYFSLKDRIIVAHLPNC